MCDIFKLPLFFVLNNNYISIVAGRVVGMRQAAPKMDLFTHREVIFMAMEINDIVGGRGGFGLGGGGDSMGVLLGLLLARGGLGDRDRDHGNGCLDQADLNGQTLGDVKAAIPLAEAQVQLALAGNQAAISALIASVGNQIQNGQTAQLLQTCNQTAALQAAICATDTNVDRTATATQAAIGASEARITNLITSNTIAELNQRLTVAQMDGLELRQRNDRDRERHSVEITMTNNQNQNQLQAQAQSNAVNSLLGVVSGLSNQVARATNSNVVVGSTGVGTAQNANPTNVVS